MSQHGGADPRRTSARWMSAVGQTIGTIGVLMLMFVVWELWWTDLGSDRRQDQIVAGLRWENLSPGGAPIAGASTGPLASPTPAPSIDKHTDTPPVLTEPSQPATFAVLYVPRWGSDYQKPISEGTSRSKVLDHLGIGHYVHTAMPGGLGNFAIAAHRTTYGKPFSRIDELKVGDPLVVRTADDWYIYRVTSTEIVAPDDLAAIAPQPDQLGAAPTGRYMTLTSCNPRYSAAQRYVVHAVLEYWAAAASGYPPELSEPMAGN